MLRIGVAGFGRDFFQAMGRGLLQFETDPVAGGFEFLEARLLAFLVAALRDGDVDDAHAGFAKQAQGKTADDAFVIGMGRKNEGGGSFGEWRLFSVRWNAAEREAFSFGHEIRE